MAVIERDVKPKLMPLIADKDALLRALEEQDARTGFVPDPTITPARVREMMRADGVQAENNVFSREIIAMREE